jgi:hypothetical protein
LSVPRRLLVLLAVSLAVLAVVAARPILLPPTNPRITEANFERIERGMTLANVEALLGPPGDYRTGPTQPSPRILSGRSWGPWWTYEGVSQQHWEGDGARITVWLDPDGRVLESLAFPMEPEPVGLLALLRWRWDHWRKSRR